MLDPVPAPIAFIDETLNPDSAQMAQYAPIISAMTALLAVVVGPIVTLHVAKKQIRANTLATFRQQWINTLRDHISEFAAILVDAGRNSVGDSDQVMDRVKELVRLESKIALLLNPTQTDHATVAQLLHKAVAIVVAYDQSKDAEVYGSKIGELRVSIVECTQPILKREWDRVKILD